MKGKIFVGIELGTENLRLVEIETPAKDVFNLRYYKEIPIPMLTLPGGEATKELVVDWEILISKLREEFKNRAYVQASVSIAIPQREANIVLVTIPPLKDKDIMPLLKREVKKTTTLEEDIDYQFSYFKLSERITKEAKVCDVLTVFLEKEKLINYLNNFLSSGIQPVVFSVKSFSYYSLVMNLYPEVTNAVIVDIGEDMTSILIFKDRQLRFVRNMYITLWNLIDSVSKALDVGIKEVRDFINKYGFDFDSYPHTEVARSFKDSIITFLEKFKAELVRSLYYYQEKFDTPEKISKIYLSGKSLKIKGIEKVFQERFKLEIEYMFFPKLLNLGPDLEGFKDEYYTYAPCVGCALIPRLKEKINLIPKIQKEKIGRQIYLTISVVYLLIYGLIYYNSLGYSKKLSDLNAKLKTTKDEIQSFPADLEQSYRESTARIEEFYNLENTFMKIQKPYLDWEAFLREFGNVFSQAVLVTALKVGFEADGKIVLQIIGEYRGTFPDAQLVLRKVRLAMEESKFFQNVNFDIQRIADVKIGETGNYPFVIKAYVMETSIKKRKL